MTVSNEHNDCSVTIFTDNGESDTRSITSGTSSKSEVADKNKGLETDEDDCKAKWKMGYVLDFATVNQKMIKTKSLHK